jgi:hypothetical protein
MKQTRFIIFLFLVFSIKTVALSFNNFHLVLNASDTLRRDTLLKITANPKQGFNFDYFLFLPKGTHLNDSTFLMVETNNNGTNDTMAYHEKGARHCARRSGVGNFVSRKLKLPFLVPVFPRSATHWQYYTHALDRDALLARDWGIARLDLQLLAMIADARKKLSTFNIVLKKKFFITGFSASGSFANRFAALHPEEIQATASGGINAMAILPLNAIQNKKLNYPLGLNDFKKITGKEANVEAFRKLPMLLYMGESDDNDAVQFDDAYSKKERAMVYKYMGKRSMPDRWKFMKEIYEANKINAEFRTYEKIGHGTDLRINNDLVNFFRYHMN